MKESDWIKKAKEVGESTNQKQVIIMSVEDVGEESVITVTSWGKSKEDCNEAAKAAAWYRTQLGFPKEKRFVKPIRV